MAIENFSISWTFYCIYNRAHHGWDGRQNFESQGVQMAEKCYFDNDFCKSINASLTIRSFNCCTSIMWFSTLQKLADFINVMT